MDEGDLLRRVDQARLPQHIAIIMDGNGRWAARRNKSRIKGHKAAIPSVQDTVQGCLDLGISHLTVYAFSQENWKRPAAETGTLMALLRQYLRMAIKTVRANKIRVNVIGAIEELATGIQKDLHRVMEETAANEGLCFNIAINYSGRQDILSAVQKAVAAGENPSTLDEDQLGSYLSTGGQPDPDLVIRTSGELRVSNFLLWQIAYSEILVTPILWPDFRKPDLFRAVLEYQARNRRFGGI